MWRQAGRALTFILQMTICTDEIWALNTARRDLERKMARLLPARQAGRCDRCHGACAEIQGITADAGQFFECVSAFEACSCVGRSTDVGPEERPYNCHGRWKSCGVFWRLYLQIFAQMPSFLHGGSLLAICSSMLPSVCIHWYAGMVLFWTPDRGIVVEGGRLDSSWLARALLEF